MSEEIKEKPTQIKLSDTAEEVIPPVKEESEAVAPKPKRTRKKPAAADTDSTDGVEITLMESVKTTAETEEKTAEDTLAPIEEPKEETRAVENEETAPTEDTAEVTAEETPSEEAPEEAAEVDERFIHVEHFSDYKSKAERFEEEIAAFRAAEFRADDAVYENLTIFDDCLLEEEEEEIEELPAPAPEPEEDEDAKKYDPKRPRKIDGRFELIELFIFTLVAVMLLTTFIFRHSIVDGPSMENTLIEGEHLIISDVFYTPKVGDIVVFQDYSTGYKVPIVKRVIATEGQVVRITPDAIYVDGVDVSKEDYVYIDMEGYNYYLKDEHLLMKYMSGYEVPEGEVFVMGDHHNSSSDSREFGTIKEESILGKVIVRIYPFDKFGKVE